MGIAPCFGTLLSCRLLMRIKGCRIPPLKGARGMLVNTSTTDIPLSPPSKGDSKHQLLIRIIIEQDKQLGAILDTRPINLSLFCSDPYSYNWLEVEPAYSLNNIARSLFYTKRQLFLARFTVQ